MAAFLTLIKKKRVKYTLAAVANVYVCSYLVLSLMGRYEPEAIGTNGVKWYAWAPKGFVHEFRWNMPMYFAYYPLYVLDRKLWHTRNRTGRYPVNEVPVEEIYRVYEAWDRE